MKLTIDKRGKKEYYDEFLYITNTANRLLKKPTRKAHRLTKKLLFQLIIYTLLTCLYSYCYAIYKDIFFLIVVTAILTYIIVLSAYLMSVNVRIKRLMSNKQIIEFEINKEGIFYKTDESELHLTWDNTKYIIINKYSITFLPKEIKLFILSTSTDYKKEVLAAIKKYNHEDLIIVNNTK